MADFSSFSTLLRQAGLSAADADKFAGASVPGESGRTWAQLFEDTMASKNAFVELPDGTRAGNIYYSRQVTVDGTPGGSSRKFAGANSHARLVRISKAATRLL